jgi:quinoprotein glucose dehydrogenase
MSRARLLAGITALLCATVACAQGTPAATGNGWPTYGGDPGGQRFSNAAQINRGNVSRLHPVWTYHTHALESGFPSVSRSDFEATPILFKRTLYLATPFDRVIALNPETGAERWTFDPQMRKNLLAGNYTSRGVAAWQSKDRGPCASRIFLATLDARLIALDAADGKPCDSFGNHGQVDLTHNIPTRPEAPYQYFGNTSPATVVGDVVVVGSAVADNQAVSVEPGVVRGFDVRTGQLLWTWDPLPWAATQSPRTGAGNAWAVLAADPANNLVFVPTGSASPDFWGGFRPGDDKDADSLVALDARTGKKIWAFQLIHHDVWDYDVASEPLLFDFQNRIPAVAIAAKTGIVFVLNRLTGEPLWPVEERPVPQNGAPGDPLSPTQPFSALPSLNPLTIDPHQLTGLSGEDLQTCSAKLAKLRYDGIFTPPGLDRGTLQFPGSLGGVNWASMSFDPTSGTLYANTNRSAYEIRLVPQPTRWTILRARRRFWFYLTILALLAGLVFWRRPILRVAAVALAIAFVAASIYYSPLKRFARRPTSFTYTNQHNMVNSPDSVGEVSPNSGAPYQIYRRVLQDGDGHPCTPAPWGATTALNLNTGTKEWEKPLGTLVEGKHTGTVNFGAPVITAGGLIFTAGSSQPLLFAIDKSTGELVWQGQLPVPAQSTPMTYEMHGRQFVVVDAGGHGGLGTPLGDSVVAFALK